MLARFWAPSWSQNRSKIDQEPIQIWITLFDWLLDRFLRQLGANLDQFGVENGSNLVPSWVQNGTQNAIQEQLAHKSKNLEKCCTVVKNQRVEAPKLEQKSSKNRRTNKPKSDEKQDPSWIAFWKALGTNLGPKWCQVGCKLGPSWLQNRPKLKTKRTSKKTPCNKSRE